MLERKGFFLSNSKTHLYEGVPSNLCFPVQDLKLKQGNSMFEKRNIDEGKLFYCEKAHTNLSFTLL